jgi:hypothetical protein
MALKDFHLIDQVSYFSVLEHGPMGNNEVKMLTVAEMKLLETDEKARLELEDCSYPSQNAVMVRGKS